MKKYDKVLFVSQSDTCRGPMAEAIMQHRVLLEDILIDSKGMVVLFPEPVNQKAMDVLAMNQLTTEEHEAVQFSKDDFDDRTLILVMEAVQKEKIVEEYGEAVKNLHLLTEYSGSGGGDISSPHGGDLIEYGRCFETLKREVENVVKVLMSEEEEYDSNCM